MNRKKWITVAAVLVVAGVVAAYFAVGGKPKRTFRTLPVDRGAVASVVSATGTIAAVTTVQVGTQISGTVKQILVDYNSPVKKGQVIAVIDPSLLMAQVQQSQGGVLNAQAGLQKAEVALADANRTLARNAELLKGGIISQADYDASLAARDSAKAMVTSARALVTQSGGSLSQASTNLHNATIRSPVDGIVISRAVDVGQTVAASFQTPTLFTIAQDLTKMEIQASIDEADIGKLKVGQVASFTVDAYPDGKFSGEVKQIRNAPVVTQNVVTYTVVIAVDNRDLRLKPGMTANVSIETDKRDGVLRLPAAALRYRPAELKAKGAGKPGEKGAGGGQPGAGPQAGGPRGKGGGNSKERKVFIVADGQPKAVKVTLGLATDQYAEIVQGELKENDQVIVEETTPGQTAIQKKPGGMGMPMGGMR